MRLFKLIRKTAQQTLNLFLLCCPIVYSGTVAASTIGEIIEQRGSGQIVREEGDILDAASIPDIELNDTAETENGRMLIQFLDEAELSLTEHTNEDLDLAQFRFN